jgi:ribosomal protein S1
MTKNNLSTKINNKKSMINFNLPKIGDLVEGEVLAIKKNEVYLDINGLLTGIIRGRELEGGLEEYKKLSPGDKILATVIDLDNEKGLLELSLRNQGTQKAWQKIKKIMENGEIINVKVTGANSGGLLCQYGKMTGFLPTSQMTPEHFPRVSDGDKTKILNLLKNFIGQNLKVKIINASEEGNQLIFSEKEILKSQKSDYKIGDIVEGEICGLVDFGAFVKFNNCEGLIHISEIAWRRLDHPQEVLKIGQKVKAKIVGIVDDKFSLSIKSLIPDPWKEVEKKYSVGQEVMGRVLKVTNFGLFVELDPEIHGLAHLSELSDKPIKTIEEINKIAKVNDVLKFKIISLEPEEHRLGLSLRAVKNKEA